MTDLPYPHLSNPHISNMDWTPGEKTISLMPWREQYKWVGEIHVSPDGEKTAAVVSRAEGSFTVRVNDQAWETAFDNVWHPVFSPDGRMVVLASKMGEWTVVVDGVSWERQFSYVWNPCFSRDGDKIAVCFQNDMQYGMAVNDVCWTRHYDNLTHPFFSPDGKIAAGTVPIEKIGETEIHKFQEGNYTLAVNGKPWETRFVNVWNKTLTGDGRMAAEVRLSLYVYTIAVDDHPWEQTFDAVWEPISHPGNNSIFAPVRTGGKWWLACDGESVWPGRFFQLWHPMISADGKRFAAIVSPKFGKWTICLDGQCLGTRVDGLITDAVFSPDEGRRIAAAAKHAEKWRVCVDDGLWSGAFDMVYQPVFSPSGEHVAVRVEKNGKQALLIDGNTTDDAHDRLWDPVFSPDGEYMMIRGMDGDEYFRRIISVSRFSSFKTPSKTSW